MENSLQINEQQLMIKEYKGKRVVHMWDIAKVHGTTTNNVRTIFKRNVKHLIENEDYFLIEKQSDFASTLCGSGDLSQKIINASKDIPVFTETGYLLMTKPMTDDRSWQVQRTLVNCYFKVKEEMQPVEEEEVKELPTLQNLSEINKTIENMNTMFNKSRISDSEKMKLVSFLLGKAGIELPQIKLSEPISKQNYISLEDIATRIGLYREDKTPNLEAVMTCIGNIGATLEELTLSLRVNENGGGHWFNIRFNPHFVERISQYLEEKKYPSAIELQQASGNILRIPVYYQQCCKNNFLYTKTL